MRYIPTPNLIVQTGEEIQSSVHLPLLVLLLTNPLSLSNQVSGTTHLTFPGLTLVSEVKFPLPASGPTGCSPAPKGGTVISIILASVLVLSTDIGGTILAAKTLATFVPYFSQVVLVNPIVNLFLPCFKVS